MKGLSTHRNCTQAAECIKQANYDFIIRYYSRTTQLREKRMLLPEAQAISNAGLQLGIVYQDLANQIDLFRRERGIMDGRYAYTYAAEQIGQPAGSAIYFAVDEDFLPADIRLHVVDYFRGVSEGFEAAAGGTPAYDIGVYGSGASCRIVRASLPFVKYSWLALATGWMESDTYTDWNIKQVIVSQPLCGLRAKEDWERVEVKSDFGQFKL